MNLREKTLSNIIWSFGLRAISYFVGFISSLILARIFLPNEYGIISLVISICSLTDLLSDLGISTILIQIGKTDKGLLYTGVLLKFLLSFISYIIIFILSPIISNFYNEPVLFTLININNLRLFIGFGGYISQIRLNIELNIKYLMTATTFGELIKNILTIILAIMGFSYWSVVLGNIIGSLVTNSILWLKYPYKLQFIFSRTYVRMIFAKLIYFFPIPFIIYDMYNFDKIIIAKYFGLDLLGIYQVAWLWGFSIPGIFFTIIAIIALPTFSNLINDNKRLKKVYVEFFSFSALIIMPISVFLITFPSEFLNFVLDPVHYKWANAGPSLRQLSIFCIGYTLFIPNSILLIASNNYKSNLKLYIILILIINLLIFPVIYFLGFNYISLLYALSILIVLISSFYLIQKIIPLQKKDSKYMLILPISITLISISIPILIKILFPTNFILFIVEIIIYAVIYVVLNLYFNKHNIVHIYNYLIKKRPIND